MFVLAYTYLFFLNKGEKVLQVTALDGDRGVPNNITYKFTQGKFGNLMINIVLSWHQWFQMEH